MNAFAQSHGSGGMKKGDDGLSHMLLKFASGSACHGVTHPACITAANTSTNHFCCRRCHICRHASRDTSASLAVAALMKGSKWLSRRTTENCLPGVESEPRAFALACTSCVHMLHQLLLLWLSRVTDAAGSPHSFDLPRPEPAHPALALGKCLHLQNQLLLLSLSR